MKKIRLTKISASEFPLFPSPLMENYKLGVENKNVSLPIDYYVEGTIEKDPIVGESFIVNRNNRNGVITPGITMTSKVTKWDGQFIETLNSRYKLEYI